ncbi:MAG TPA: hypothetical protein VNQ90_05025 [Chthoniobacteraceae bacterium]|nr:hypothetical protein [Chthoniobacteraceae bacterium]
MKTDRTPQTNPILNSLGALLAVFLGLFYLQPASAAVITADFSGGADTWPGLAGEGWLNAWAQGGNGFPSSAVVLETGSLTPGKNRLQFTVEKNVSGADPSRRFYRRYDTAYVGAGHVVSFQFRLDSDPADLTHVQFLDASITTKSINDASWFIEATSGGNWRLYDGNSSTSVDTGLQLFQNNVYDFSIHVSPDTYVVTIRNLTTLGDDFTSGPLSYQGTNLVGGYLNFNVAPKGGSEANPSVAAISLGSISIQTIPEPGTVALMGAAVLLLLGHRLLKGRSNVGM